MKKKHKLYHPRKHRIPIATRMLLRRIWYIFAPVALIGFMIFGYITIQVDMYQELKLYHEAKKLENLPSVAENQETNKSGDSDNITQENISYQSPIDPAEIRVTQKGTGLSFITQADARKIKNGIHYSDINKYGRPGKVTAKVLIDNAEDTDFSNISVDSKVITINMISKAFGGESVKENQVPLLTEVYSSCYAPIIQSIYDYAKDTQKTVIIIVTPTWSNIQYNMPDNIRIDAYTPDDFGESLNVNFVIHNIKSGNEITDYRNPENN